MATSIVPRLARFASSAMLSLILCIMLLDGCGDQDPEPGPVGTAKCPGGCTLKLKLAPLPLPGGSVDINLIDRDANTTEASLTGYTQGTKEFIIDCNKKYRVEVSTFALCEKPGGGSGVGLWYGEATISPQKCVEEITVTLINTSCN